MTIDRTKKWAVAGLVILAACGGSAEANSGAEEAQGPSGSDALVEGSARVINVETAAIELQEFREVISLTGTAWANQDVMVSAEESGVVRSIVRDKGTRVAEGDWILKIDDRILQSQVDEARAQAELARQTWERRKRLYEEDQVGSELAYLEARYAAEQTAARLATLEERLARTVVKAPISGTLDQRLVEVGAMVSVGTQVARVVSLNPIKVVAGVPERYAADVREGARASVYFDVLDEAYEGTVSYVASTVNPRNRTFGIELVMENPGRVIKPEMLANLQLVRAAWSEAIVVPQGALIRTENGYKVFVVENDTAVERTVVVGASEENNVMIESGLEVGDRLVVVGQQQIEAGDRVNIVGTR